MPVVTVLRGFKISVSTLDAFLSANKVPPTEGNPPFYEDHPDRASNLLFSKVGEWGDKKNYRIIVPQRVSHAADTAYVTYSWFMVYAQGELRDDDLPPEAPPAFESLRKEVLSFSKAQNDQTDGKMGTYVVFTEERTYLPEFVLQRNMIKDIKCDFCDKEWTDRPWAWIAWQAHRVEVHGVNERHPKVLEEA